MKKTIVSIVTSFSVFAVSAITDSDIESLISQMTLEEKVGQLVQLTSSGEKNTNVESTDTSGQLINPVLAAKVRRGEVGSLIGACGVEKFNAFQKIATEESRLKIPTMVGHDMIHGVQTQFPIGPALACLWDEATWYQCGRLIALETPLKGCNWTFTPMVDIARDARWGRIAEGPGQDPLIASKYSAAMVKGIQSKDVATPIAACLKHYVAYGASFQGRDYNAVEMDDSTLRNVYLPSFKAGIDAGALTIMPAFHTYNGVPCSVNQYLLTDVLRGVLGFNGFCISDYNAIGECFWPGRHGVADCERDIAAMAVNAGMDQDMLSCIYTKGIAQAVKDGLVSEKLLDERVRNVLRVKNALGLFENPYIDLAKVEAQVDLKKHAKFVREVAARCCVLLKNEKSLLPLAKDAKVLVVGPYWEASDDWAAKIHFSGTWSSYVENNDYLFPLPELEKAGVNFRYRKFYDFTQVLPNAAPSAEDFAWADVVVAMFGEKGGESGEGNSHIHLELPAAQLTVLSSLKASGKPLVALLSGGRPLAIPELAESADAILDIWSLGTSAGGAIVDVLTGKVNPEGRLSVEIPYATGQMPLFYNRTATSRPAKEDFTKYVSCFTDGPYRALYPFGFGLSYTTFDWTNETAEFVGDELVCSVEVANTGKFPGVETVQVYTHQLVAVESRPIRELKGFARVKLEPGESQRVEVRIPRSDLAFWAKDKLIPASGPFEVFVAPDSVRGKKFILQ